MLRLVLVSLGLAFTAGCAVWSSHPHGAAPDSPRPPKMAAQLERATGPDRAMRWRRLAWLDERGEIAPGVLQNALRQRADNAAWAAAAERSVVPSDWIARGPINVGGRTRAILIDPRNSNHLWAGAVSGGIWRSTDRGATWTQANDWLPNLAICCLAMDPANPDVMYAGTGEGFFNSDAIGGTGIYRTTDGGTTWNLLPSTASWDNVCRIAISPTNSNVLLAATRYGGIRRSTNGGVSWTTTRSAQGAYYVAFDPTNAAKAVAHIIDYDWNTGDWYHAAIYSTNGGGSWTTASGLAQVWGFGSRIELAYAPSDPSIVYAACATDGGKIWRSTDGGHSYTLRTTSGGSGCNWYANPLWVDPTNPNVLLSGGYAIYRSTDGGVTLNQISDGYLLTTQPHPDIHCFVGDPGFNGTTNRRVYTGTDGGVHRTENVYAASSNNGWVSLQNTYLTTQFYGAAGDGPTGRLYGGTQDNGTLRVVVGSNQGILPFGGDGGFCAIDPVQPAYCYGEYVTLQIHRSTNGGQSADYIYSGLADAGTNANFIAPFILDSNDPNRLLAGGASLWRTNDARAANPTWNAIRAPGSDKISAIAVAPGNSNVIWVAQNDGKLYRTKTGLAATPVWFAVDDNAGSNPLPDRYITRILIDPDSPQIVYVTLGGFSPDNVWKTVNNGAAWSPAVGTGPTALPSAPVRGITRHPLRTEWLYAGTEVGIYESLDGGATWSTDNRGPANVSVDEVTFLHHSNTLLAATHGRGLWTADIPARAGDCNGDQHIDAADFALLAECLAGPSVLPPGDCGATVLEAGQSDGDADLDLADMAAFQLLFGGA